MTGTTQHRSLAKKLGNPWAQHTLNLPATASPAYTSTVETESQETDAQHLSGTQMTRLPPNIQESQTP